MGVCDPLVVMGVAVADRVRFVRMLVGMVTVVVPMAVNVAHGFVHVGVGVLAGEERGDRWNQQKQGRQLGNSRRGNHQPFVGRQDRERL
jgi:hypothetical protein